MAFTGSFIEVVKKYPSLYDASHDDYRNSKKKDKIWEQVGAEVKQNGEEVKKKWKNLRDTYVKYIKSTTGQAPPNNKKWQWADQMEAFLPFLAFSKTTSSLSDLTFETFKSEDDPLQLPQEDLSEDTYYDDETENSTSSHILNVTEPPPMLTPAPTVKSTSTGSATKKRKLCTTDDSKPTSSVEESLMNYFQNQQKPVMDPIDLLFLAHANTVKTFSGKRQAITKMKIAQVIMEEEILHHEERLAAQHHIEVYTT